MRKSRFSEEQIVGILKEQEAGIAVAELCRKHGVSSPTFYKWKAKYGGLDVSEARRLKALEDENSKLKRLLADAMLDNVALKDLLGKCMTRPAHAMYDPPCPCKGRSVVTVPVCANVSGLSRVDRCCGQALMRSARIVPR
jgi:putative transposase